MPTSLFLVNLISVDLFLGNFLKGDKESLILRATRVGEWTSSLLLTNDYLLEMRLELFGLMDLGLRAKGISLTLRSLQNIETTHSKLYFE